MEEIAQIKRGRRRNGPLKRLNEMLLDIVGHFPIIRGWVRHYKDADELEDTNREVALSFVRVALTLTDPTEKDRALRQAEIALCQAQIWDVFTDEAVGKIDEAADRGGENTREAVAYSESVFAPEIKSAQLEAIHD